MPELPEVEAMRRLAEEYCVGRKVAMVVAREAGGGPRDGRFDNKVIGEGVTEKRLVSAITGRTVTAARRCGKQLWLEFDGAGPCLLLHFGMTGSLAVDGVERFSFQSFNVDESWPPRFTKLQLEMAGSGAGRQRREPAKLAFADPRRFGKVLLRNKPEEEAPISMLAADPVIAPPMLSDFTHAVMQAAVPVKSLLLDQERIVCGVGNWLADEVLHEAGILPTALGRALSERQAKALHAAVCKICRAAVAVDADSARFPKGWLFHCRWGHGPKGEQVKLPDGSRVCFTEVGGRTTAYVPTHQHPGEQRAQCYKKSAKFAVHKRCSPKHSEHGKVRRRPAAGEAKQPRKRPAASALPKFSVKLRGGAGHGVFDLD